MDPAWTRAELTEQPRGHLDRPDPDPDAAGQPALTGVLSALALTAGPARPGLTRAVSATLTAVQALGDAGVDVPLGYSPRGGCRHTHGPDREPGPGADLGAGPGRGAGTSAALG